jgi:CheY-specific phosphatase CheX
MKYLVQLIPVDEDKIADMESELPFTLENALIMMENSNDFDAWLTETIGDLANFTTTS